jgi:hypothetical protein
MPAIIARWAWMAGCKANLSVPSHRPEWWKSVRAVRAPLPPAGRQKGEFAHARHSGRWRGQPRRGRAIVSRAPGRPGPPAKEPYPHPQKKLATQSVFLYSAVYRNSIRENSKAKGSPAMTTSISTHIPPVTSPSRHRKNTAKPSSRLTRGSMLVDICLVLAWGATIPGLMWLGVAGGL